MENRRSKCDSQNSQTRYYTQEKKFIQCSKQSDIIPVPLDDVGLGGREADVHG